MGVQASGDGEVVRAGRVGVSGGRGAIGAQGGHGPLRSPPRRACGGRRSKERPPSGGRWRATKARRGGPLYTAEPRCVFSKGTDVGCLNLMWRAAGRGVAAHPLPNRRRHPPRTPSTKERAGMDARSRRRSMRRLPGGHRCRRPRLRRRPCRLRSLVEARAAGAGLGWRKVRGDAASCSSHKTIRTLYDTRFASAVRTYGCSYAAAARPGGTCCGPLSR